MTLLDSPLFGEFRHFRNAFEPEDGILRLAMRGAPIPCFSEDLLNEARAIQRSIEASRGHLPWNGRQYPIDFVVLESAVPGVFNLGGDIALFHRLILQRDREGLSRYARLCVDLCHASIVHYKLPCQTISLVAGKALGGGMESALSGNVVIAERSAEFALPEVLFNLFPGMGAYNLIARKVGTRLAEEIMTSGRTYTGAELHRLGLVDVLAADDGGEQALHDYVRSARGRRKTLAALARVRETVAPISHEELLNVVDIWVDAALELDARDLRRMEMLVVSQARAFDRPGVPHPQPAVAPVTPMLVSQALQ